MLFAECASFLFVCISTTAALAEESALPKPGVHGRYAVLTGEVHTPPPFQVVDIVYGPREQVDDTTFIWWQLSARDQD